VLDEIPKPVVVAMLWAGRGRHRHDFRPFPWVTTRNPLRFPLGQTFCGSQVIDDLLEENRVLRAAHGPRRVRLTDDQRRRLAVKGKVLGGRRLADIAGIVTPDTILRWYRRLVAKQYDGSTTRRPGRPSTTPNIAALVVRMATENPTWGDTRIRGGLKCLCHDVARNTINAILKDHGSAPAPERGTTTPWKTFLAAHGDGLAAADFFTVEVLTWSATSSSSS
jgi:hypothetical protein